MNDVFTEGDFLDIGEGTNDGFYLMILTQDEEPFFFKVKTHEPVLGDYYRILKTYIDDPNSLLDKAKWVLFGYVMHFVFFVIDASDQGNFTNNSSPMLYSIGHTHAKPGYYLRMFDTDVQQIRLFKITKQQADNPINRHYQHALSQIQPQDSQTTSIMTGRISHDFFHVLNYFDETF